MTAVWMASQSTEKRYGLKYDRISSSALVIFSGRGADELIGRYKGISHSLEESLLGVFHKMNADLGRLWFYNFG